MKNFLFALFLSVAFTASAADKKTGHQRVGVDAFHKLWKEKKLAVIDVRTPGEFSEGHIPGAKNIDYRSRDFKKKIGKLDKSKEYLVHCRSGGRSAAASKIMVGMGFKLVYDLADGMMGWEEEGKPVSQK
ncbi:MAG: rhodanese-like domain-containing protein [Limisphaerales bacterium]